MATAAASSVDLRALPQLHRPPPRRAAALSTLSYRHAAAPSRSLVSSRPHCLAAASPVQLAVATPEAASPPARTAIRLGLPSKGRMAEETLNLLKNCQLSVRQVNPRQYVADIPQLANLEVWFQRPKDIVRKLQTGDLDLGIVGFDTLSEYGEGSEDLIIVHDALEYGDCHLSVAIPMYGIFENVNSIHELAQMPQWTKERPLRIATGFTHLGPKFMEKKGLKYVSFSTADGALEAAPAMGIADAILDLVSSGTTLRENNLKEIEGGIVLQSQAVLVARKKSLIDREGVLGITHEILERLEAHLRAIGQFTVRNGTRVLIPVPGGLVEIFVSKEVTEDHQTIDFVMARCNTSQPQSLTMENQRHHTDGLHWDLSSNPSPLYASHLNLPAGSRNVDIFFEDSTTHDPIQTFLIANGSLHHSVMDSPMPQNVIDHEKEFVKHEIARVESGSEGSEQADNDKELRHVRRGGKRHHQFKNLDKLYNLRALVPKITKMDWASILGDAIGLVMELQKQVKDLQDELEDMAPDNDVTKREDKEINPEGQKPGLDLGDSLEVTMMVASNTKIAASKRPMHGNDDNGQQMEPQVEVRQLDANVKVFCEHKQGGFARLLEAMNSLELEVTNVNVMTFLTLEILR